MLKALVLLMLLASGFAQAAAGSATHTNPGSAMMASLLVAGLAQKRPIGGWLLFFYFQLFAQLLLTPLTLPSTFEALSPARWESGRLYLWYVLATVPVLLLQLAQLITAGVLLFQRNLRNLRVLRFVLAGLLATAAAALGIDVLYFGEYVAFDTMTTGFAAAWLVYFWRSKRVRKVFITRVWETPSKEPLTATERQYLNRRALLSAAVIFVLTLVGEALLLDAETKANARLFVPPVIYGVLGWLVGRFLDLSPAKRAALAGRVLVSDEVPAIQPPA